MSTPMVSKRRKPVVFANEEPVVLQIKNLKKRKRKRKRKKKNLMMIIIMKKKKEKNHLINQSIWRKENIILL